MHIVAQLLTVATLVVMLSGRTPLYTTAIVGSTLSALVYGLPITGDADVTIRGLVLAGMNPVIADMAGVLVFIGVMEHAGYLDILVRAIIRAGARVGGGPGVATAGGIGAGIIGAFTGFTQPAITGAVTGPASVRLGVDPNQSAGTHAHAGNLGNFAGFTHPTLLAVMGLVGLRFGWINAIGVVTGLSIFSMAFLRMRSWMATQHAAVTQADKDAATAEFAVRPGDPSVWMALLPFLILVVAFSLGYPVFLVGFVVSVLVMFMARTDPAKSEAAMMESVKRVAVPLVATIGFLFMSGVIGAIGINDIMANLFEPALSAAPILTLALISAFAGLLTQSNSASAAIILPIVSMVIDYDPNISSLAVVAAACGPTAIMQYFLTGGPVAALATVIPVVPRAELKLANRFMRPNLMLGLAVVVVISVLIGGF
ncbi:MAG: citrate transporter [Candidatus Nanopelagicales bacterium]